MTISDACAALNERQPVKPSHAQRECEEPLARLVTLTAPEGETELAFWRRKAAERAKDLAAAEAKNRRLTLRILGVLEEEA